MTLLKLVFLIFLSHSYESQSPQLEKATFAGGCFWCMEPPFEKEAGVISVISGFSGGTKRNPVYSEVASGKTSHIESVQITYNSKKITYIKLLEIFWKNINPTDSGGQFVDRGHQYSTAIFFHTKNQETAARASKEKLSKLKIFPKPIVTDIRAYKSFYPAEDYHQDFYKKNLVSKAKYKYYRKASGRDKYINKYKNKIKLTD